MNDVLEDRLHRVLSAEAERGPSPSLTAADVIRLGRRSVGLSLQPSHRRRWTSVAAGASAATAAIVVVVVTTVGGATPAFASWTSRPAPAASPVTVDGSCRSYGRPVIVDRRGHTQYSVYAHASEWVGCLGTVPGETPDHGLGAGHVDFSRLDDDTVTEVSPADPLVVLDAKSPESAEALAASKQAPVTFVSGRAAPNVARVTIETDRGEVVASLWHGYFAAWWPGNDGDTDIVRAYDSSGALLSTIDELSCSSGDGQFSPRVSTAGHAPVGGCR